MDEISIRETLNSFQLQLAQTATTIAQGLLQFRRGLQQVTAQIQPVFESIADNIGPFFVELSRALEHLPESTRSVLAILAQHGWYVDPEMDLPRIADVVLFFERGETTEGNGELLAYFEQRKDAVLRRLCSTFPQRANIFTSAFAAHAEGKYELSIPVLLAQADGICLELIGVPLYSKQRNGKTTRVSEIIATFNVDGFTAALLHPLTEVFPITFSSKERVWSPDILNRHAILHGESTSYGTHINGCKAISLLSFTAWALSDLTKSSSTGTAESL